MELEIPQALLDDLEGEGLSREAYEAKVIRAIEYWIEIRNSLS